MMYYSITHYTATLCVKCDITLTPPSPRNLLIPSSTHVSPHSCTSITLFPTSNPSSYIKKMLLPLFKISLLVFVLLAYKNPTMSSTGSTNKDLVMAIGREGSSQRGQNGSAWLKKVAKEMYPRPRASTGCWNRPWICNQVESSSSSSSSSLSNGERQRENRMCCRNRCVEVSSDENNCGVCGVRCPFGWQCCNGLCMNTNTNPFHCGNCFHRCHLGTLCLYGLCGYALPLPPFTFPIPFPPDHPKIPNSHPPPMPS